MKSRVFKGQNFYVFSGSIWKSLSFRLGEIEHINYYDCYSGRLLYKDQSNLLSGLEWSQDYNKKLNTIEIIL